GLQNKDWTDYKIRTRRIRKQTRKRRERMHKKYARVRIILDAEHSNSTFAKCGLVAEWLAEAEAILALERQTNALHNYSYSPSSFTTTCIHFRGQHCLWGVSAGATLVPKSSRCAEEVSIRDAVVVSYKSESSISSVSEVSKSGRCIGNPSVEPESWPGGYL